MKLIVPAPAGAFPGVWEVYDQDGILYPTPTSTTQGLQEAINLAYAQDVDLIIQGGGTGAVLFCNDTITIPPTRHRSIKIYSTTINIVPTGGMSSSSPGILFDSTMMADFYHSGQIVYWGKGRAVMFSPTTPTMPENEISFGASKFIFGSIACMVEDGFGVCFGGPIDRNYFSFEEINGKNDSNGARSIHGIEIQSSAGGFVCNDVRFQNIHGFKNIGLRTGTSSTSAIYGNRFTGNIFPGVGTTTVGVQCFSKSDFFNLAIVANEGSVDIGVKLESSASLCYFLVPKNAGATKLLDASTAKNCKGFFG